MSLCFFLYLCTMRKLLTLSVIILSSLLPIQAKEEFTPTEQQQISVETPGLFEKSEMFRLNFAEYDAKDYSFPLPVGKVVATRGGEMEIETKKGDAVKAMFEGKVRLARHVHGYGNVIVLRHHNGLETMYAHNAQNLVKVGDHVRAGQTVAIVGEKDGRTMCVVALMVNGRRMNPATILDTGSRQLRDQTVIVQRKNGKISLKTSRQKKESKGMSMDTNNPFGTNSVYRLDLTAIKPGDWHYPLDDSHVISGYGGKRRHSGTDIKNGPGTDIYAAFDGLVVQAGTYSAYGKCITIRHANGLETRYSHNAKNLVTVGDRVKAGQVIGKVGRTGRATTEHLHFETRINDRAFDSSYVFDHKDHTLQQTVLQFKKNGSVSKLK